MLLIEFMKHFIGVVMESAPWLLFGFFIAGVLKILIPETFLHRHLGKKDKTSVFKGAILGAPLPLCSCGVIPAALGLRRAGASKAATTSFLIATPETGVDSVSITYALLGPMMAVIRPIAAVTTSVAAGLAVLVVENKETQLQPAVNTSKTDSCCSSEKEEISLTASCEKSSCCTGEKENVSHNWCQRLYSGIKFSFIDLINDTSLWLLIGFAIAAFVLTFLSAGFLEKWGATPYAYIIMASIGVPMYICATSSTPIAASLLFAGVSPGAILVFLLVGPATNVSTLAIVRNELGNRVMAIYLTTIVVAGFVFGWLTDLIYQSISIETGNNVIAHSHGSITWLQMICGLILFALLANGLRKKFARK